MCVAFRFECITNAHFQLRSRFILRLVVLAMIITGDSTVNVDEQKQQ